MEIAEARDTPDLGNRGLNSVRGFGVAVIARLPGGPQGMSYVEVFVPALERLVEDPAEQVLMQLPSALLRFGTRGDQQA
jgi:hypothetical protein